MTFENISPLVPAAFPLDWRKAGLIAIRSANKPKLLGNKARGVMIEYTVAVEVSVCDRMVVGFCVGPLSSK